MSEDWWWVEKREETHLCSILPTRVDIDLALGPFPIVRWFSGIAEIPASRLLVATPRIPTTMIIIIILRAVARRATLTARRAAGRVICFRIAGLTINVCVGSSSLIWNCAVDIFLCDPDMVVNNFCHAFSHDAWFKWGRQVKLKLI